MQVCAFGGLKRESIRSRQDYNFAAIRQRWRTMPRPRLGGLLTAHVAARLS
jgi:hypothetical protein